MRREGPGFIQAFSGVPGETRPSARKVSILFAVSLSVEEDCGFRPVSGYTVSALTSP